MNKLFTMQGRIRRSTYFWTSVIVTAVTYSIAFVAGLFMGTIGAGHELATLVGSVMGLIASVIIGFAAVKRLHDIGRPGVHYWLFLVPLYNIYLGFVLLFQRGNPGANKYGNNPVTT